MTLWKPLSILLAAVVLMLCVALAVAGIKQRAADAMIDKYIEGDLTRQGYVAGSYAKPVVTDAPAGSKPLVHMSGAAHYAPGVGQVLSIRVVPNEGAPETSPTQTAAAGAEYPHEATTARPQCNLGDLDVVVDCTMDVIPGATRPLGRLVVGGQILGFGQRRDLPPLPVRDVTLQVDPSAHRWTWRLDFLGGLSAGSNVGAEFGLAWKPSRSPWGGYALAEADLTGASAWRIHAGVKYTAK